MQNEQVSIARGWAAVEEARRARGGFGRGGGVRESGSEESVRGLGSRSGGLTARPVGLCGAGRPTEMLGNFGDRRTNGHRATATTLRGTQRLGQIEGRQVCVTGSRQRATNASATRWTEPRSQSGGSPHRLPTRESRAAPIRYTAESVPRTNRRKCQTEDT